MLGKIKVINLNKRTDRWESIKKEFSEYDLERFSAIEHQNGWRGCGLSHMAIIQLAKDNDEDYIIVLEDDTIIIDSNFKTEFHKIITYLENNMDGWDIFSMGCTYSNEGTNSNVKLEDELLNIISYQFGKTTNFMIYNKSSYDIMLELKEIYLDDNTIEREAAIDIMIGKIGLKILTRLPFLCIQKTDYSDILGAEADYLPLFKQNEGYLEYLLAKHSAGQHVEELEKEWIMNSIKKIWPM